MEFLKRNWKEFENKSVKPVWNLFSRHYSSLGLEYEDFVSIAYIILNKEIRNYNADKSGVYTYCIRVLKRRMADYSRNTYNTEKTRANFCLQSLNVYVSEDSEVTLEDNLIDDKTMYKSENNIGKIKRFFKTLSNKQKDILFLTTIETLSERSVFLAFFCRPLKFISSTKTLLPIDNISLAKKSDLLV